MSGSSSIGDPAVASGEHRSASTSSDPLRVGIAGCGDVSADYFRGLADYDLVAVEACADIDSERARQRAEEFNVPRMLEIEELLADAEIELVVNLTPPGTHYAVTEAALDSDKHVYSEKPLATTYGEAAALARKASTAGLTLGCAPDTSLGGAIQTCRKAIDDGWIGEPLAATAFVVSHGYEHFHPRVDYYYQRGGGPILDVGPYYLTAIVHLLGPFSRVSGSVKMSGPWRAVPDGSNRVRQVPIEVPTHVAGTVDCAGGAVVSVVASWDVWASELPYIEIYGTEGVLSVPNPDFWDGVPRLLRPGQRQLEDNPPRTSESWKALSLTHRGDVRRGIGVAETAHAIRYGSPHRTSGEVAGHVLEALMAFELASETGEHVALESSCQRPAALPSAVVGSPVGFGAPDVAD